MKIQANASGTRSIEVSEKHLMTLKKYALLKNLIDSNGIIDEDVLACGVFGLLGVHDNQANGCLGIKGELMRYLSPAGVAEGGIIAVGVAAYLAVSHGNVARTNLRGVGRCSLGIEREDVCAG
jgi:hypothetical protein